MLLGGLLTFVTHRSSALVTPADPFRGMVKYGALMFARMTFALVALAVYYVAARDGLAPFGVALGISFVVGLVVEAVRASCPNISHTSA